MKQVIAVVVTYKRKVLLSDVLRALVEQSVPLTKILVIDNDSRDGTEDVVQDLASQHPVIEYYNTGGNLGGAGGFHFGFVKALDYDFDHLWLMDDDLLPEANCLEELLKTDEQGGYDIIQPLRVNKDGTCAELSPMQFDLNTFLKLKPKTQTVSDFITSGKPADETFKIAGVPFEGPLIKKSVIDSVGLPDPRFFIFYDDMDFSIRAIKSGFTIGCTIHARATRLLLNNQMSDLSSWKGYFMFRNLFHLYFIHGESASSKIKPFVIAGGFILLSVLKCKFRQAGVCFDAIKDSLRFVTNSKYIP